MAEDITFVVHRDWLENIKGLSVEQQDKIIADFVRYGLEMELEHDSDPVTEALVNMLKGRIDYSKDKYEERKDMAKKAGRKKKVNDELIYNLAKEGKSSSEIALTLGYSKSAVDHSDGWRRRKEKSFENSNENDEEFAFLF